MEPILLYGHPLGSSLGLIVAFEWLGAPYRLCRVDMLREMRNAPYARLNARHETPALVTSEGRLLTETMVIAAWMEARDIDRRISFELRTPEADRMHQLIAFLNTGFTAAFSPLWPALEMENPDPVFQAVLRNWGRACVIERHDKLEDMLTGARFLAGDKPTLADGIFIGIARWLDVHEVEAASRWSKIATLRQRLEADPAVSFAIAIEIGERPTGSGACRGHVALSDVIERYGQQLEAA